MSHISTIKSRLNNIVATQKFVQSMKDKGFSWVKNGQVRYYGGRVVQCENVIRCPGQYDIGVRKEGDKLLLDADWNYADFYSYFGVQRNDQKGVETKILEGQNEFEFRSWADERGYAVEEVVDEVTGKRRLEVPLYT